MQVPSANRLLFTRSGIVGAVLGCSLAVAAAASCNDGSSGSLLDCANTGLTECQVNCQKPYPWSGTTCDSFCVDPNTDTENCGYCGFVCPAAQMCVGGRCVTECPSGDSACSTDGDGGTLRCFNTTSDDQNCGACGRVCPEGTVCSRGQCSHGCSLDQTLCSADGGPKYCADLAVDNRNCGACGNTCPTAQWCAGGGCVRGCQPGQDMCGTVCTDTQSDNANCGSCGKACGVLEGCTAGQCTSKCLSNQITCGADAGVPSCTDYLSDNTNCGACGKACPSGRVCTSGSCIDPSCTRTALAFGAGSGYSAVLKSVGFTVKIITNTYAGTPPASGFSLVVFSPPDFSNDMPAAGQTSIVNAQAGGTGVLFTEQVAGDIATWGTYGTLAPLLLFGQDSSGSGVTTFGATLPNHPIWNALPPSFKTTGSLDYNNTSKFDSGAVEIANCIGCGVVGVAASDPSGAGRIVQMAQDQSSSWSFDANLARLTANAALWAARCD